MKTLQTLNLLELTLQKPVLTTGIKRGGLKLPFSSCRFNYLFANYFPLFSLQTILFRSKFIILEVMSEDKIETLVFKHTVLIGYNFYY